MDGTGFAFGMDGPEQRHITIKTAEFLKSVTKTALKLGTGAYTDALNELPDVAASLGVKATPQKRVGALILRALERALVKLVGETIKVRDDGVAPNIHAATFAGLSENLKFEVTRDFFKKPNATGIVEALKPDAEKWLSILGLPETDISNILHRIPSVFTRALHAEWRSNSAFYAEILDATDSPFIGAAIMEQEWSSYRAYLVAMADERVFDESFSLRQIYVESRCYFFDKQDRSDNHKAFGTTHRRVDEPKKVLRWIFEEVMEWIGKKDRDFAIRTVAGGPGSGKSSFAKILASHLAELGGRVLFVPLHQIDLDLGISRALSDYFIQAAHFSEDPVTTVDENPTVLILDGLDEIQMQGRVAQESAQSFISDLMRFVDRKNTTSCNLLCVVTGRDLAIQSAEGSLKIESQVLHLAPYFIEVSEKSQFFDKMGIFDLDQRDQWWMNYGKLTGLEYEKMPDALRAGELNEVTSQPLLNYLVALAYRRGLSFNESNNINSVYEDLLKAVHARAWARHSHPSVKDVPYESFVRLLEEVALSVWHGAGRTTTLAEVELHCQQSKVGALLPSFQSGVSSGVSSLLLAFYFRQKGRRDDGSKTFEFTHKTFAEYLISLRVIRLVELVSTQMAAHNRDPDFGIDEQDALYRWLSVCGQTALDSYLLDFIRREISFRSPESCAVLQASLCGMLESALSSGWPVQRIPKLGFNEQLSYVRNAEETLLACLNACALVSRLVSDVKWPSSTSAGEMISRLQGQRKGPGNRPVLDCLSYLNLDRQYLDIADLYNANMHHSSFVESHLNYTILMYANLTHVSLIRAELERANLSSAKLNEARISADQLMQIQGEVNHGLILDENDALHSKTTRRAKLSRSLSMFKRRGLIVVDENDVPMSNEQLIKKMEKDYQNVKRRLIVESKRIDGS